MLEFRIFLFLRHSFSAFTAYRGRGLVNLQCCRLKSRDVSTRVVEENFRNVTSRDKEFGKFPKSTFACPCAYVHNFIPLHWKCKDIYLCRQRKLKQVSLSYSPAQRRQDTGWVVRRVWIPLLESTLALLVGNGFNPVLRGQNLTAPFGGCTLVLSP